MLVYGDGVRRLASGEALGAVAAALERADGAAGLDRHEALVEALIDAGALAQAVADAGFTASKELDEPDDGTVSTFAFARAIAAAVVASWRSGFRDTGPLEAVAAARAAVDRRALPDVLDLREPEGFAHYAVYPEAYAEAAAELPDGPLCVVGLRSIGTTLAATVAAARPDVPLAFTLRPVGHPFRREVRLGPEWRRRLAACPPECRFAVVDEGPGLSGSSIAAAIVALEAVGISAGRIHVLASHAGELGPEAGDDVRRAWARVRRHAVTFDDLVLRARSDAHRLEHWCVDLVGAALRPLEDVSGGAWRAALGLPEEDWPPVMRWQERRKFLLRTASGTWLLRFAGLGRTGREKRDLARSLAGHVPDVVGLRHGFLVERWEEGARPLNARRPALPVLARYLARRAALAPPPGTEGATVRELYAMLLHNAGAALGQKAEEAAAARWEPLLSALAIAAHAVLIDGRMQPWEWIETPRGLLKADAVDHHAGHDLVGVQDIAWDVAGAIVEFGLDGSEAAALAESVGQTAGRPVDADLVRFMVAAYGAFQLGYWTMARDDAEAGRIAAARRRYRASLADRLCGNDS